MKYYSKIEDFDILFGLSKRVNSVEVNYFLDGNIINFNYKYKNFDYFSQFSSIFQKIKNDIKNNSYDSYNFIFPNFNNSERKYLENLISSQIKLSQTSLKGINTNPNLNQRNIDKTEEEFNLNFYILFEESISYLTNSCQDKELNNNNFLN